VLVAEALARVGVERITLLDFDTVEMHNLDRLLHARQRDALLARASRCPCPRATALRHRRTSADPRP
jgi:molybdopterin/thiamine biosynthesis adenylyltransferase